MAVDYRRQVLALRPNAQAVKTPVMGWLVFDGEQCLDNGGHDFLHQESSAWWLAFRHLMHERRQEEQ